MGSLRNWYHVIFLIGLPFEVISLTCEEATAQIRKEIQRTGVHTQQLNTHLTGLVEDVRSLVDNQGHLHNHRGVEYGCHIPSLLQNGQTDEAVDWFGQKMVLFNCNTGFTLVGSPALVCTDGHWNDSIPQCAALDCKGHLSSGKTKDGVYGIIPDGQTPVLVYCDMTTDGGGWTVFQRRVDDSVDFYLTYAMYQHGFGDLKTNFWLGLDTLHSLTQIKTELYVDMMVNETHSGYARYNSFAVGDAASSYLLSVSGYSGTYGDQFSNHNGDKFSTYDRDQDAFSKNCAEIYKGGWWYSDCYYASLNGLYFNRSHQSFDAQGINWSNSVHSLRWVEMKLRRKE